METLGDLAHMVEPELHVNVMTDNPKSLMAESSRTQCKHLLDPTTVCWSERGFIELMKRTLRDVAAGKVHAVLCGMHILNTQDFKPDEGEGSVQAQSMLIAQFIRRRLPANVLLCLMSGSRACAMFAARCKSLLREQIATFLQEPGSAPMAGIAFSHKLEINSSVLH